MKKNGIFGGRFREIFLTKKEAVLNSDTADDGALRGHSSQVAKVTAWYADPKANNLVIRLQELQQADRAL